jgi:hypothetical protein
MSLVLVKLALLLENIERTKDPSPNMGLIDHTSCKLISELMSLVLVKLALLLENIGRTIWWGS